MDLLSKHIHLTYSIWDKVVGPKYTNDIELRSPANPMGDPRMLLTSIDNIKVYGHFLFGYLYLNPTAIIVCEFGSAHIHFMGTSNSTNIFDCWIKSRIFLFG